MEQVDLIWGKARVKALIRVLIPSLVNLRLGTCQFSILGCEMILAQGQIINEAFSLFFFSGKHHPHTHFPAHHVHKFGGQHLEAQSKETLVLCSVAYPCVTLRPTLICLLKKDDNIHSS